LAVSETCIIVILILSKLKTKILYKTFSMTDNIFITNCKIEKVYAISFKADQFS
jgi:hypothetical protein